MNPAVATELSTKDLTIENITQNVIAINSQGPDARLKFVFERLVTHLHDFARETRLSTEEWMAGVLFLTAVGQRSTRDRQEFILLSDILGLSLLVDAINHPKPPHCTEGTILGPFHSDEAEDIPNGEAISHDSRGELLLVLCTLKDTNGNPIEGARIDVWESDSTGNYDLQYDNRKGPDGRALLRSDKDGRFWFTGIKPVSYGVPTDGPTGDLLKLLHRHPYRPGHLHMIIEKPGYNRLITALYRRGDPYETTDSIFGVKESLVVDMDPIDDATAKEYNMEPSTLLLRHDFVLATEKEAIILHRETSKKALADLGLKVKLVNGLPVPDVD